MSDIKIRMFYHHAEWVLNHSRFGILMTLLIAASFINNVYLAAALFLMFAVEIVVRVLLMRHKIKTYPYRGSTNRKLDLLFLVFDIIGALSLLVTVFQFSLPVEDATLARMMRAVYLLRTLRIFRYIDLQSAIYSPTYGMVISLLVLLSFFATDYMLWIVLMFFGVELIVRLLVMRDMNFASPRVKAIEWGFWWIDLIATIAMMPGLPVNEFGTILRSLRLVRLFRPWLLILSNLKLVIKEGQYFQEINLIVLLLAVLSIAGGVAAHYLLGDIDFTNDGIVNERDQSTLAHIWFAFRTFADPGNVVFYPENNAIAVYSVMAVVIGVFVFAFFIGIGANIVSGLMHKLRNEHMNIANHMVMLGWNEATPFILRELRAASQRSYTRMKVVLLNHSEETPDEFRKEDWVTLRWGDMERQEDLKRVNLGGARQVIVSVPEAGHAESLSHSFFSLLAIRDENPDVYVSYALPGYIRPRLKSHHHPLQVGWDKSGQFNRPTVVHSLADVRSNLFRQVLHYRDFDQVLSRLMIPPRIDESALTAIAWEGGLVAQGDEFHLSDGQGRSVEINALIKVLFERGVILVSLASPDLDIQTAAAPERAMPVATLVGIALNSQTFFGEVQYVMANFSHFESLVTPSATVEYQPLAAMRHVRLVVFGWIGGMALVLKRMLQSYERITVVMIDSLSNEERFDQEKYLHKRLAEMEGASERIDFRIVCWDYTDMETVRAYVSGVDRIILAPPIHIKDKPHAFVASVLSDLMCVLNELDEQPMIFPVVDTRDQAQMLQKQMEKYAVDREVHLVVPNEFYGTYVAHTSYHMYVSHSPEVYEMHRALRYVINDLMSDEPHPEPMEDAMSLDALLVNSALPDSAQALFNSLLDQGYLWIGFCLQEGVDLDVMDNGILYRLLPRELDFQCLRQRQIVINPRALATSIRIWSEMREAITELIVIRMVRSNG